MSSNVVVIGGGAAGLAAALKASEEKCDVTLIERDSDVGGVLNQCIHNGFGLDYFKKNLTGPEFKEKLKEKVLSKSNIKIKSGAFVHSVEKDKNIVFIDRNGVNNLKCDSLVITTGAKERPFTSLGISGKRLSGIYSAGLAQKFINMMNLRPGNSALIVGSGDIGLIMARRLTLEGVKVEGVIEIMPYPGGLQRNIKLCLEDFSIPLYLSRAVKYVDGDRRVNKIITTKVDDKFNHIGGDDITFNVDTLVSSVGLVPNVKPFEFLEHSAGFSTTNKNRTSENWIFSAGNSTVVFDLVDYVAQEGEKAGYMAALQAKNDLSPAGKIKLLPGKNIGILYPSYIEKDYESKIYLRARQPMEKGVLLIPELGIEKEFEDIKPSEMIKIKVPAFDKNTDRIEVNLNELK
ncbi:MAG: FAD-dependent oxidoreductase [Thermotogae bacterium]|nr:FAD-dependent oxidoreductase [Thermotogota bacterium]